MFLLLGRLHGINPMTGVLAWSDRQGRKGEGLALNEKETFDCTASPLVMMWLRGSGLGGQKKDKIL